MARKKAPQPLYIRSRAPAPDGLTDSGRKFWESIVNGHDPDYFSASDVAMLEEFVRCRLIIDTCNETLGEDGLFVETQAGQKAHPALAVRDAQIRNLALLGGKLRLPVSSRVRSDSASTRPSGTGVRPWEFTGAGDDSLYAQ